MLVKFGERHCYKRLRGDYTSIQSPTVLSVVNPFLTWLFPECVTQSTKLEGSRYLAK